MFTRLSAVLLPELSLSILMLLVLSTIILAFLIVFIIYRIRKRHLPIDLHKIQEGLGSSEWELVIKKLAREHKRVKLRKYNFLLNKYNQILYKKINRIRYSIARMSSDIIALIPSARWLFDNFQMIYREIKKIKTTGTGYLSMPVLLTGKYRGYPRIYVLAKKMVDISGAYLNESNIILMVKAYQEDLPLTGQELHSLTEMIGLCLLERVIEVSRYITAKTETKYNAEKFVKGKLPREQSFPDIAPLLVKINEPYTHDISFHCHVIHMLQNMAFSDEIIQRYIDFHCAPDGRPSHSSEIFKEESLIESALESSIRTPIVSLREVNQLDEQILFEELSSLEAIFMQDPAGVYPKMSPESRAQYRTVIKNLARRYRKKEEELGKLCLKMAEEGFEGLNHSDHIGAYTIGRAYGLFKKRIKNRTKLKLKEEKRIKTSIAFFGLKFLLAAALYLSLFYVLKSQAILEHYWHILAALIATPIFFEIASLITNNVLTRLVPVKPLPSMDYLEEIPDEARTIVVMPVIVSNSRQSLVHLENLHKHYLANRQANLFFALLLDYPDAQKEEMPEDHQIREALEKRLDELNKLHPATMERFSVFIRHRVWNEAENCFMGWERKRGKLEEFNALLNGIPQNAATFSTIMGPVELLSTIKYVLTLDADSDLIKDNAARLVGIIDHPLNRAVLDTDKQKITEGYAIIQPSIRNHILDRKSSLFPKIYKGQSGVATYSMLTSDLYQDLFQEGTFIGKGIYNAEMFHRILHRTLPENRILSHDLLESSYARTAFASNVNLLENFPANFLAYIQREHRWIRGDWQLLPYLFKRRLSILSRWKMLDNLRASLVPLGKLLFVFILTFLAPSIAWIWLPLFLFPPVFNLAVLFAKTLLHKIRRPKLALVLMDFLQEVWLNIHRAFLDLVFIPVGALNALDAVLRTVFRLAFSKKNLLMWNPADIVEKSIKNTVRGYFIKLWPSFIPAGLLLALLFIAGVKGLSLIMGLALSLSWFMSFLIAWSISQPGRMDSLAEQKPEDIGLLVDAARRTWRFFRKFSTDEHNWFCPDSYQFTNREKIAFKASPTNIGLQLLSVLSARDLGFESLSFLLDYLENLLYAISFLPKWEGHLFNWYDTKNFTVLNPQYVSTVDSGNFLGNLVALKNGLLEEKHRAITGRVMLGEILELLKMTGTDLKLNKNPETLSDFYNELRKIEEKIDGLKPESHSSQNRVEELKRLVEAVISDIKHFNLFSYSFDSGVNINQLAEVGNPEAIACRDRIDGIVTSIQNLIKNMNFRPLYNARRRLFHIGYNHSSQTLDNGCYDLIASESLLSSFLAIARGEVAARHWARLGRPLTQVNCIPAHVSWSGTMFEYLMPNLVMESFAGSVFDESNRAAVMQQMKYARRKKIPWGISESQYYRFDLDSNYQYRAFGVPRLRLQPAYSNSLVVSPYSTMLALELEPEKALGNLKRLREMGMYGEFGYYEAIDFNLPDPVTLTPYCIVKSFMAHHQGMSIVAINNFLNNGIMRRRFHAEPFVRAAESILEEKRQSYFISISRKGYTVDIKDVDFREEEVYPERVTRSGRPSIPVVNHISNGEYSLMINSDGDGFSEYNETMLYKWRPDVYANTGHYIYVKDIRKKKVWSTTFNPTKTIPDDYHVRFSFFDSKFARKDDEIITEMTVSIFPDTNLEVRKVTLHNYGDEERPVELTSYLELAADSYMAELSHPAFNKLFLESEYLADKGVFLSRRRKGNKEQNPFVIHMVKTENGETDRLEYTNDRLKFIGRNNTLEEPEAVFESVSLGNSTRFTTDPIMSIRIGLTLDPQQKRTVYFVSGVCKEREEAIKIADDFNEPYRLEDAMEKFRQQSLVELKYLNVSGQELNAFQNIISPLFYPSRFYRGPAENIRRNWKNQSFLWRFGVSGSNPIMLFRINSTEDSRVIKDVLKAYEYIRINRVKADLIILNEAKFGYNQELTDLVNSMTSSLKIFDENREKPSLFVIPSYQLNPAELDLLFTVARVVFTRETGIYFGSMKIKNKGNLK